MMEVHEICDLFPEMTDEEFSDLFGSISKYGQLEPIVTHDEKIVDGRHRYRACCLLGLAPRFEEWHGQGGTLLAFVVGRNLNRRNMTASQRAAVALDVKARLEEEGRERMRRNGEATKGKKRSEKPSFQKVGNSVDSTREAAEMMNVNHQYVTDAEHIRDESPETFEKVKRGEVTIPQAKRERAGKTSESRRDEEHRANPVRLTFHHNDAPSAVRDFLRYFGTSREFTEGFARELNNWLGWEITTQH